MNQFKEEEKKQGKKRKSLGQMLVGSLELELLSKKDIRKWLPFILFMSALAFFYISNRLKAEKQVRYLNKLQVEIRDIEADYHTLKSEIARQTQRSNITEKATDIGLIIPKKKPEVVQLSE
ncbi:MAG: hypothetical protein KDC92_13520 [Bacteroidetes bacterium]|nr:hypothetical protein [Bacteroidota bacterium]